MARPFLLVQCSHTIKYGWKEGCKYNLARWPGRRRGRFGEQLAIFAVVEGLSLGQEKTDTHRNERLAQGLSLNGRVRIEA